MERHSSSAFRRGGWSATGSCIADLPPMESPIVRRFLLAVVLALTATASVPSIAAATGDCAKAKVVLYQNSNYTGSTRTICYGVNDSDVESEAPTLIIGPTSTGTYYDDFDPSGSQSGIMSAKFYDNGGAYRVCFYTGQNQTGNVTWLSSNGSGIVWLANQTPGSIYINATAWCA